MECQAIPPIQLAGASSVEGRFAAVREAAISQNQEMLRVEQGLRTVMVAPPDAADVGSPAAGG